MKRDSERIRKDVAAHRARQLAAGRIALTTYVPTDLLAQIDKIKEQRGVLGRAPIIEEALRLYMGVSQTLLEAAITQPRPVFSCFVNLLQSEEARKQIILVIDGPAA